MSLLRISLRADIKLMLIDNPDKPGQFSYCQYPFILSIVAKRNILTKDSEQQMILTARKSLIQKMASHQQPHIEIFFLNITVRRFGLITININQNQNQPKTKALKELKPKYLFNFNRYRVFVKTNVILTEFE
jgi:hypothetical protein